MRQKKKVKKKKLDVCLKSGEITQFYIIVITSG